MMGFDLRRRPTSPQFNIRVKPGYLSTRRRLEIWQKRMRQEERRLRMIRRAERVLFS